MQKIRQIAKATLAARIEEYIRKNNSMEDILSFFDEIEDEIPTTISEDSVNVLMDIYNVLSPIWNLIMQEKIRMKAKGKHCLLLDMIQLILSNIKTETNEILAVMKTPKVNELYNHLMKIDFENAEFIFINPGKDTGPNGGIYSLSKEAENEEKNEIRKQIKKLYNSSGILTCYFNKEGITYISIVNFDGDWHIYSEREIAQALLINKKYTMKLNNNQRLFDLRSGNILK